MILLAKKKKKKNEYLSCYTAQPDGLSGNYCYVTHIRSQTYHILFKLASTLPELTEAFSTCVYVTGFNY